MSNLIQDLSNLEHEEFRKLTETLKAVNGLAISCDGNDGDSIYELVRINESPNKTVGKGIIRIFFHRKYVEFTDEFAKTVQAGENFNSFIKEFRKQGYSSNCD